MVRNTLDIPVPSGGLNTEISDLKDVPAYTKDELNMDILSDGSRARRLGLEYEKDYNLSNISAAESIQTEGGQIVKLTNAFSCYEWSNYKGDGKSIVVVQIGDKICFFEGINNGVLSGQEVDWTIDLNDYAVAKIGAPTMYAWTHQNGDEYIDTVYTESSTPSVGDIIYRDRTKEEYNNITVEETADDHYVLSDDTFVYRDSSKDTKYVTSDYRTNPVSFASAYGTLFICSPYIEVLRVKFKDGYTYTEEKSGSCKISLSPMYWTGYEDAWNGCFVTIQTKNQTTSFNLSTYGIVLSRWRTTSGFVDAFNSVPSSLRQNFTVSGDGGLTYTFYSPAGDDYNGSKITLGCYVMSCWKKSKGGNWRDGFGGSANYEAGWPLPYNQPANSVRRRDVSGVISGATTQDRTIEGYREVSVISPQVRDTTGVEEPDNPGNDIMPTELTNEHMYNLLNQGWDGTYTPIEGDPKHCTPGTGKIKSFKDSQTVYPSNALSWYVLKDANGTYAPSTVVNKAFGTSLAPRGKMILNAYDMNRAGASGVYPIPSSPFASHRPEDICFFAGRLWYALDGRVLYSQIVSEDTTLADRCYQAADPTSEDVQDIIETDGGVMNIQQCGKILRLAQLGSGLCVFGDKGVIAILPGNSVGFTPTSYYQQIVSSVGAVSKRAVISVGDAIFYWSALGIYKVGFNENGQLSSVNISFGSIHTFFKNLSPVSINNCVAKLNSIKNDIHFMYPTNDSSPKQLDAVLKYNIIENTWTPRNIPLTSLSSPFIVDAIELKNSINTQPKAIVESEGETVLSGSSVVEIKKKDEDYIGFDNLSYLVIDGNSMRVTFANCTNIEHKDWTIGDVSGNGYNFNSYLITHPIIFNELYTYKQAPYITTVYKRTEEGDLFKSGCFMSARWDWTFDQSAFKWDSKQQTYRLSNVDFDKYKEFVDTKTRVRGSGKALQLKFENDENKSFRLCAIGIDARGYKK